MDKSKSRLFLIELVVIILFFSIAAAVCTNMFAHAKTMSASSMELTMAMAEAQEAAETFKSAGGDMESVNGRLDAQTDGQSLVAYYDSQWQRIDAQSAYTLRIEFLEDNGLRQADISVYKQDEEIYRVKTAFFGDGA